MKVITLVFALSVVHVTYGQLSLGMSYFQDSVVYREYSGFGPSDLLTSWDEFVRINVNYKLSNKYQIDTWVDLNSAFNPQNFKIGVKRSLQKWLYMEGIVRNMRIWIPYLENTYPEVRYDQYHKLWQFGAGLVYQWKSLEFNADAQILLGTRRSGIQEKIGYDKTNFIWVDSHEYETRNFKTFNYRAGINWTFVRFKASKLSLSYLLVIRRDFFDFKHDHWLYEWTRDDPKLVAQSSQKQLGKAFQHQFGLVFSRN